MGELKKVFFYSLSGADSLLEAVQRLTLEGATIDHSQTYRTGSNQYVLGYYEGSLQKQPDQDVSINESAVQVVASVEAASLSDDEDGPFGVVESDDDEIDGTFDVFDFSKEKTEVDNKSKLKELAALTKKAEMFSFAEKYGLVITPDLIQPSAMKKSMQKQLGMV